MSLFERKKIALVLIRNDEEKSYYVYSYYEFEFAFTKRVKFYKFKKNCT